VYPVCTLGQQSKIINRLVLDAQIDVCVLQLNPPEESFLLCCCEVKAVLGSISIACGQRDSQQQPSPISTSAGTCTSEAPWGAVQGRCDLKYSRCLAQRRSALPRSVRFGFGSGREKGGEAEGLVRSSFARSPVSWTPHSENFKPSVDF